MDRHATGSADPARTHRVPAIDDLLAGQRRALAKAITLVESSRDADREAAQTLLQAALPHSGHSMRIGISGSPGVGKSTFIEAFGRHLIQQGHKVAVLAVDPSSPVSGGSILGDKTRMEELSREPNAFIRPSPSAGALGGVAQKTRETKLLCEAAGYDVILVETVGVGQSEYQVAGMVDFFLVLMLPNAGDELQGIKKGILELADAVVINKADGELASQAERTRGHYQSALDLLGKRRDWTPRVMTCSALEHAGIDTIWQLICEFRQQAEASGAFSDRRAQQNLAWMQQLILALVEARLTGNDRLNARRRELEQQVRAGSLTPYAAAQEIVDLL